MSQKQNGKGYFQVRLDYRTVLIPMEYLGAFGEMLQHAKELERGKVEELSSSIDVSVWSDLAINKMIIESSLKGP